VKSIFINVTKDINICDKLFRKDEIRLMRRVVRDYFNRGSSAEHTMRLWTNVRENEEKNIIPYAKNSDYLINSLLLYEVFVISKYFIDITEGYSVAEKGSDIINSLRERLHHLTASSINSAMVPMESVFREFIV
jgi:uridine kinase